MFNGGGEIPPTQQVTPPTTHQVRRQPQIRIIEQPASKAIRFRYECEGRSAGSIPGASSTSKNRTYPTIQVVGYQGRALVIVSCVTKDPPYRAHPHNLVGREGCMNGVCKLEIPTETMTLQFSNLGIQCVKKKDIQQALKVRERLRIDPFKTGFGHRNQPTTIDLNVVRLCFQVHLEGSTPGNFSVPLKPVVSDPIYDKKAIADLSIVKMSHCTSSVGGGKDDMILLCEKVAKEDIQVRFYEENGDWEELADCQPTQVYKQHAIWFKTPKYKTVNVTERVKVFIQLRRPSDGATSEPVPFELLPLHPVRLPLHPGKRMIEDPGQMLKLLQGHDTGDQVGTGFQMDAIKFEPRDKSPSPYHGNLSPYVGLTPQYVSNLGSSPIHQFQHTSTFGDTSQQQEWNTQMPQQWQGNASVTHSNTKLSWNIPLPSGNVADAGTSTANNIGVQDELLDDLDTREVNSDEIRRLMPKNEDSQLPEIPAGTVLSFSDVSFQSLADDNRFSFSDLSVHSLDNNMMDSIERLERFAIDNI